MLHDILNLVPSTDNEDQMENSEKYFPIYHVVGIDENFDTNHEKIIYKDLYGFYNVYILLENDQMSHSILES
jgi:hypothetical protein